METPHPEDHVNEDPVTEDPGATDPVTETAVFNDEGHYHEEDDKDVTVYWNIRRTTRKPVQCCCCLCGVWIFLIIVLGVLAAAVGSIEFSIDVPFYDRSEINQQREDAYAATERDADFVSSFVEGDLGPCVHDDPTILTRNGTLVQGPAPTAGCQRATSQFLRLIYITSDRKSNILSVENLEQIKKIEQEILNHIEFTRYCYLLNSSYFALDTRDVDEWARILEETADTPPVTAACERIQSPVNHLDSLYFDTSGDETGLGYYLLGNDQVIQEYNFSQGFLDSVVNYWSNFGQQRAYDLSEFDAAVATVGDEVVVSNLLWAVTSTEFTTGSDSAVGLTSTIQLGLPINTYSSSSIDSADQYEDVGRWLWEEFDSFLKGASFDGVDVYFNDNEDGMSTAEEEKLAFQSISLFPISVLLVLLYLIVMQDSFFVGFAGIMQVLLAFVPTLIVYRYVLGIEYIGVLNLISFYIILGIGVDDIFVFTDQFTLQGHHEKRFDQRMQKTYFTAGKAMFTTSCTTFISFISNATSVFPAVSAFGIFSALLVLMNFCAVTTFFPAVYAVYHSKIRQYWWDHPTRLFCCNKSAVPEDGDREVKEARENEEVSKDAIENKEVDGEESEQSEFKKEADAAEHPEVSFLFRFFRDTWAPTIIRWRYIVLVAFVAVLAIAISFASTLTADQEAPSTLPEDNNYKVYSEVVVDYFARAGNPRAIEVRWVSGINPDDPIDRSGTDDTIVDDYGTANYVDCEFYNPATPEAQVWSLQTCHDLYFGNVTEYHGTEDPDSFGVDGANGPKARRIISEIQTRDDFFYARAVTCPAQDFRDWLLTDNGCAALLVNGLECFNITSQRPGCTTWGDEMTSCEPYPVPESSFINMFSAFLSDPDPNPSTQLTNYDVYKSQVFVNENFDLDANAALPEDFSCRTVTVEDQKVFILAMTALATLDQDFALAYEDGIDLYDRWDAWSEQMRFSAPREMLATSQTSSGAWAFYFLNETLLNETFIGIMLALILSFVVLTVVGGNIIMAALSVFTILLIVIDVIAFTVLVGWDLGVIEAVNYVVVIGMSIDYSVHMSEAYTEAHGETRAEKVTIMVEDMAVSVLSGALSTLLAAFPMFFAPNTFFIKFASFLFCTIFLSCTYALTFFPAMLAVIGPLGNTGMVWVRLANMRKHCVHEFAKNHVQSKQYWARERELMRKSAMQNGEEKGSPSESPKDEQ